MSKSASSLGTFFRELRRRKVFQVAVVYAVVGWVLIQVVETIFPRLHLPDWSITLVIVFLIIGFPVAIIVAWALELTPEGVKRTEALEGEKAVKPSAAKPQPSIVVLPFDDISPGKENEYFSDGLTEEIITDLSYVHQLRVISRSSAMTFKGTNKTVKTIAHELDVQYVLEGSVRKVANDLRITAQLIDATSDAHLWAEKYSGTLDDVFDIQEKVSRSIVDALKMKLNPEEKKKIAERPIENMQAYECYLLARQETWRFTNESLERALQYLQKAHEIIGDNEFLYAAKGTIYWQYVNLALKPAESYEGYLQKADECARRVFDLNPNSSLGHFLDGEINLRRGNPIEAIRHFKRAVEIDPNNPEALIFLGFMYDISGKESVALQFYKKAREIDPLSYISLLAPAWNYIFKGQFNSAIEPLRKIYQKDTANRIVRVLYMWILAMDRQFEEAISLIDWLAYDTTQTVIDSIALALKNALQGNKREALQALTLQLRKAARWDELISLWMAQCYALIDEKEEALDWLEHAVSIGIINYPFLNEYDPFLENIRGEKRFKKLMEKVKYEWEHFEV